MIKEFDELKQEVDEALKRDEKEQKWMAKIDIECRLKELIYGKEDSVEIGSYNKFYQEAINQLKLDTANWRIVQPYPKRPNTYLISIANEEKTMANQGRGQGGQGRGLGPGQGQGRGRGMGRRKQDGTGPNRPGRQRDGTGPGCNPDFDGVVEEEEEFTKEDVSALKELIEKLKRLFKW
jgi:hypothetical protein